MMAETKEFISKGRLDALTDGVFAFAMTLLVVNFDLPEDFHPTSARRTDFRSSRPRRHVHRLRHQLRSARNLLALARASQGGAGSGERRLRLVLALPPVLRHPPALLDDCCRPLPPRAGDMGVWNEHGPPSLDGNRHHAGDRARHSAPAGSKRPSRVRPADRFGYLSMAIGFYRPDGAMYAYFLNLASPLVRRWTERA